MVHAALARRMGATPLFPALTIPLRSLFLAQVTRRGRAARGPEAARILAGRLRFGGGVWIGHPILSNDT